MFIQSMFDNSSKLVGRIGSVMLKQISNFVSQCWLYVWMHQNVSTSLGPEGLYHALSLVQVEYNPIVLKSILTCVCVLRSEVESHCNMTAHISLPALMNVDNSLRNVGNLIAYLIM